MRDVNWWLMTLAFLLGLVLTLGLMIRRVTREVPVTHTLSAGLRGGVDVPEVKKPDLGKVAGGVAAAGAAAVSGAAAKLSGAAEKVEHAVEEAGAKIGDTITGKDILEEDPYGSGSIRVTRRAAGPAGYTVKGDKDTGRYFSPGSPEYDTVEAEVWFANEESAEKAGFLRWDAEGVVAGAGAVAATFASIADVPAGPYGKGSAKPNADGSGPAGWLIKGNADSMLYHPPTSSAYNETIAEVWFFDEETAEKAGFDPWDKNFR